MKILMCWEGNTLQLLKKKIPTLSPILLNPVYLFI